MTTEAAHPFVIGDEPVVTFERTERNTLSWLQGFARRNVEAFLPVSATTCLHILARFERTRQTRRRLRLNSTVNMGQTAGATKYCFGNIESQEIDVVLQPKFGKMRMGITGFNASTHTTSTTIRRSSTF